MKHAGKSSVSILKEKSSAKKTKNNHAETSDMGIRLTGKELISEGEAIPHPVLWFLAALGQMVLLAGGFCGALITGLSLSPEGWILYPGILVLCVGAVLFFGGERLNGYRIYGMMAGGVFYALVLFFTQRQFLSGACQVGNAVLLCMNRRYESNLSLLTVQNDSMALAVFLLEIFVPVILWMAAAAVYRPDFMCMALFLFPALTVLFLTGGSPSVVSLFLLLFGILCVMASSRSVRRKRLWGDKESGCYRNNLIRYQNIRKKTALLVCGAAVILSVPGFYIVRPGLSLQLEKAERITARTEGKLMEAMVRVLPGISAGNLKLRVETAGGGVSDGSLGDTEGYVLQGIEDLKITSSSKPEETIYLKGYVGSGYAGDRWLSAEEENFLNAAMNWKTEGDPRLYIQNLPFLRALYIENEIPEGASRMQQLTVERLNADSSYTYYPYCSYLNDYYQIKSGDGYVAGQSAQDDVFSYYPRSDWGELAENWNGDEDSSSVLDRVEASYAAYAASAYLDIPEGFEELEQQCREQEIGEADVEQVSEYIRAFLSDGYTFSLDAPGLPEGEDFVKYFLYESRTGYSAHYVSAAVLMFRMFGIPSRYVVGYAAPRSLFTAQPDGTYTAVLQDDNSHAWAEIYVEGDGWTPVETTPGGLGTAEDVEFPGDGTVNQGVDGEEQEAGQSGENLQQAEEQEKNLSLKKYLNGNLESVISVMAAMVLAGGGLTGGILFRRRRRKALGLNRKLAPGERICDIFQAYYGCLVRKGMSPDVEAASEAFAEQVRKQSPSLKEQEFSHMMELVMESCYGFREKNEKDVEFMRDMYKKLRKDLFHRKIK